MSAGKIVLGAVIALAAGAVLGMLFAPAKGSATRKKLMKQGSRYADAASETAGEYTNDLMGFMRMLNQIAGNLEDIQPENLAQLAEYRQKALGPEQELAAVAYAEAITLLKPMTPRQAVEYLLQTYLREE